MYLEEHAPKHEWMLRNMVEVFLGDLGGHGILEGGSVVLLGSGSILSARAFEDEGVPAVWKKRLGVGVLVLALGVGLAVKLLDRSGSSK